jgi:hypothetical protein
LTTLNNSVGRREPRYTAVHSGNSAAIFFLRIMASGFQRLNPEFKGKIDLFSDEGKAREFLHQSLQKINASSDRPKTK